MVQWYSGIFEIVFLIMSLLFHNFSTCWSSSCCFVIQPISWNCVTFCWHFYQWDPLPVSDDLWAFSIWMLSKWGWMQLDGSLLCNIPSFKRMLKALLCICHFKFGFPSVYTLIYTLYGQKSVATPVNYGIQVFQSNPLQQVYKVKHLAMQSPFATICDKKWVVLKSSMTSRLVLW